MTFKGLTKKELKFIQNELKDIELIKKMDELINKQIIKKKDNITVIEKEYLINNEDKKLSNLTTYEKENEKFKNNMLLIMDLKDYEYINNNIYFNGDYKERFNKLYVFNLNFNNLRLYIKNNYINVKKEDFIPIYKLFLINYKIADNLFNTDKLLEDEEKNILIDEEKKKKELEEDEKKKIEEDEKDEIVKVYNKYKSLYINIINNFNLELLKYNKLYTETINKYNIDSQKKKLISYNNSVQKNFNNMLKKIELEKNLIDNIYNDKKYKNKNELINLYNKEKLLKDLDEFNNILRSFLKDIYDVRQQLIDEFEKEILEQKNKKLTEEKEKNDIQKKIDTVYNEYKDFLKNIKNIFIKEFEDFKNYYENIIKKYNKKEQLEELKKQYDYQIYTFEDDLELLDNVDNKIDSIYNEKKYNTDNDLRLLYEDDEDIKDIFTNKNYYIFYSKDIIKVFNEKFIDKYDKKINENLEKLYKTIEENLELGEKIDLYDNIIKYIVNFYQQTSNNPSTDEIKKSNEIYNEFEKYLGFENNEKQLNLRRQTYKKYIELIKSNSIIESNIKIEENNKKLKDKILNNKDKKYNLNLFKSDVKDITDAVPFNELEKNVNYFVNPQLNNSYLLFREYLNKTTDNNKKDNLFNTYTSIFNKDMNIPDGDNYLIGFTLNNYIKENNLNDVDGSTYITKLKSIFTKIIN